MSFEYVIKRIRLQLSVTDKYLSSYLLCDGKNVTDDLLQVWCGHLVSLKPNDDPFGKLLWVIKQVNCYHFHLTSDCHFSFDIQKNIWKKLLVVYSYQYLTDEELIQLMKTHCYTEMKELTVYKYLDIVNKKGNEQLYKALYKEILQYCNDEVRNVLLAFSKQEVQFDNDPNSVQENKRNENSDTVSVSSTIISSNNKKQRKKIKESYRTRKYAQNVCYVFYDKSREGNDKDLRTIQKCFTETLRYTVNEYELTNWKELDKYLKKISMKGKKADLFIGIFLCHGSEGYIKLNKNEEIPIFNICDYFKSKSAPFYNDKPKVFMFQSCRGVFLNETLNEAEKLENGNDCLSSPENPNILLHEINENHLYVSWICADRSRDCILEINDRPDGKFRKAYKGSETSCNVELLSTKPTYEIRIKAENNDSFNMSQHVSKSTKHPVQRAPDRGSSSNLKGLNLKDFCLIYASIMQHAAARTSVTGSLFIQNFLPLIEKEYERKSIHDIHKLYNQNPPTFKIGDIEYKQMISVKYEAMTKEIHLKKSVVKEKPSNEQHS